MRFFKRLILASLFAVASLACGEGDSNDAGDDNASPSGGKGDLWENTGEPPSWEEFQEYVYCEPDADVCIVEGDLPISGGEEAIRQYYDERVASRSALTVRHAEGLDTRWPRAQRFDLTYCVADAFGDRKGEVVDAMAEAADQWQDFAHVEFRYVPEADADCDIGTDEVLFPVMTAPSDAPYFARAFFPDYDIDKRQVRVHLESMDRSMEGSGDLAENLTLVGIMRHELGHVLGFRHEHTRPETNYTWCFEDEDYRPVTEYDSRSVMHYPQCNGDGDWSLEMTELDAQGAQFFYPDWATMTRCYRELDGDGNVRDDCEPVEHQIVELANSAFFETLDEWVGLDRRAVEAVVEYRDEQPFHTLADLKEMHYLKEHGVRQMYDYLYVDGRCAEEIDEDGRPLSTCRPVANRILELANTASFTLLDDDVRLDRRAAQNIVDARQRQPFDSLGGLWLINYVKTRALGKMYAYLYVD